MAYRKTFAANLTVGMCIALILTCTSCYKDDGVEMDPVHPQLQNLQEPDIILNNIATGRIEGPRIRRISLQNYSSTPFDYRFEYIGNTNQLRKITVIQWNYASCEVTNLTYHYRPDKLIDKIVSKRTNTCLEFEVLKTYDYNYKNGLLKSIIMDNESFIAENHFSYNPDGTIAEIYGDFRPVTEPLYGYSKVSFQYNENQNVISLTGERFLRNDYDKKYTFTYDDMPNPFKGLYIGGTFQRPGLKSASVGPFFLSNHNVTSVKEEYLNKPDIDPKFEYFEVNTDKKKVTDYGNDPNDKYWFRYYIYYE